MSKFHFRLATLLQIREAARDERRMMLAEAQRAESEIQKQLAQLEEEQKRLRAERRKASGPGAVDPQRLDEAHRYASILRAQQADLYCRQIELNAEIDRRRDALLEAERELRALEKLRDHQTQFFLDEQHRQEGKRLDEVIAQSRASKPSTSS